MSKMLLRVRQFIRLLPDLAWYLSITLLLPLITLVVLGLTHLYQQGILLHYLLVWTGIVLCVSLARSLYGNYSQSDTASPLSDDTLPRLTAREEWTPKDHEAWAIIRAFIDDRLLEKPTWAAMKDIAIEQHATLANIYFPGKANGLLSFTLPELLLVLEETSTRYRHFIKHNVPFADSIELASINTLYQQRGKAEKGYKALNTAIRLLRLTNPLAAATSEIRDHVTGKALKKASDKMQLELKRALLEELGQVGIDLYSGRLKISDAELAEYVSSAGIEDQSRLAKPVESLRVILLGQSNAGKSSLINALSDSDSAEVDLLQTTDSPATHTTTLAGDLEVNFIDTQGCDGSPDNTKTAIDQATSADVVVWLCKATQPGRSTDTTVLSSIEQYFNENPVRIPPPMLLIVTHIDRLRPTTEWNPPYDLTDTQSAKANSIAAAVHTIENTLPKLFQGAAIDISLAPGMEPYNIDQLKERLAMLSGAAKSSHLNRRRIELTAKPTTVSDRLRQSKNLISKATGKFYRQLRNPRQ